MKRVRAAFLARSVDRDHRASIVLLSLCALGTLLICGAHGHWGIGWTIVPGWAALWVWGLWDEGGRIVPREYRRGPTAR